MLESVLDDATRAIFEAHVSVLKRVRCRSATRFGGCAHSLRCQKDRLRRSVGGAAGRSVLFISMMVWAGQGLSATAATLEVSSGAYSTIQGAIAAAAPNDEIIVGPGTYAETIDFLGKAITVRSSGGAEVTILDGTGLNGSVVRCVVILTSTGGQKYKGNIGLPERIIVTDWPCAPRTIRDGFNHREPQPYGLQFIDRGSLLNQS